LETPTQEGIETAGAGLNAAIEAAVPSVVAYATLIDLIDSTNEKLVAV